MTFDPAATVAGPLLVTLRSALVATVAVVVELLLPLFGSLVAADTLAVLATLLPFGADGVMRMTNENAADPPAGNEPRLQEIVPVPPTAGVEQMKAGPLVWLAETNVVLAGVVSVRETVEALDGPLFVTVTV